MPCPADSLREPAELEQMVLNSAQRDRAELLARTKIIDSRNASWSTSARARRREPFEFRSRSSGALDFGRRGRDRGARRGRARDSLALQQIRDTTR